MIDFFATVATTTASNVGAGWSLLVSLLPVLAVMGGMLVAGGVTLAAVMVTVNGFPAPVVRVWNRYKAGHYENAVLTFIVFLVGVAALALLLIFFPPVV